jgi:hypothetical protein
MKVSQFLDVVPKPVKIGAYALLGCAAVIGVAAVLTEGINHGQIFAHGVSMTILASYIARGLCFGLLGGVFSATWVLCLGYVYADARRRAMPPILWTLIAAFIPNLLGFLLYFALRRPIALPCTHCGRAIAPDQPYCSWCGYQGSSALSSQPS